MGLSKMLQFMFDPEDNLTDKTIKILSIGTNKSDQTVQTLIRLLLQEQSDQGLHCLSFQPHFLCALLPYKTNLFHF